MSVWLGNFVSADDGGVAYQRQRDTIKQALQDYGTDHVEGIAVGNEFMLKSVLLKTLLSAPDTFCSYLNDNDDSNDPDPDGAIGQQGAQILIQDITDTRQMVTGLSLPKTLTIGTAEAGSFFNTEVLESVDFGMSNVHPWFANVTVDEAADWTAEFFQVFNTDVAEELSNQPTMYIAETGWPTVSFDL